MEEIKELFANNRLKLKDIRKLVDQKMKKKQWKTFKWMESWKIFFADQTLKPSQQENVYFNLHLLMSHTLLPGLRNGKAFPDAPYKTIMKILLHFSSIRQKKSKRSYSPKERVIVKFVDLLLNRVSHHPENKKLIGEIQNILKKFSAFFVCNILLHCNNIMVPKLRKSFFISPLVRKLIGRAPKKCAIYSYLKMCLLWKLGVQEDNSLLNLYRSLPYQPATVKAWLQKNQVSDYFSTKQSLKSANEREIMLQVYAKIFNIRLSPKKNRVKNGPQSNGTNEINIAPSNTQPSNDSEEINIEQSNSVNDINNPKSNDSDDSDTEHSNDSEEINIEQSNSVNDIDNPKFNYSYDSETEESNVSDEIYIELSNSLNDRNNSMPIDSGESDTHQSNDSKEIDIGQSNYLNDINNPKSIDCVDSDTEHPNGSDEINIEQSNCVNDVSIPNANNSFDSNTPRPNSLDGVQLKRSDSLSDINNTDDDEPDDSSSQHSNGSDNIIVEEASSPDNMEVEQSNGPGNMDVEQSNGSDDINAQQSNTSHSNSFMRQIAEHNFHAKTRRRSSSSCGRSPKRRKLNSVTEINDVSTVSTNDLAKLREEFEARFSEIYGMISQNVSTSSKTSNSVDNLSEENPIEETNNSSEVNEQVCKQNVEANSCNIDSDSEISCKQFYMEVKDTLKIIMNYFKKMSTINSGKDDVTDSSSRKIVDTLDHLITKDVQHCSAKEKANMEPVCLATIETQNGNGNLSEQSSQSNCIVIDDSSNGSHEISLILSLEDNVQKAFDETSNSETKKTSPASKTLSNEENLVSGKSNDTFIKEKPSFDESKDSSTNSDGYAIGTLTNADSENEFSNPSLTESDEENTKILSTLSPQSKSSVDNSSSTPTQRHQRCEKVIMQSDDEEIEIISPVDCSSSPKTSFLKKVFSPTLKLNETSPLKKGITDAAIECDDISSSEMIEKPDEWLKTRSPEKIVQEEQLTDDSSENGDIVQGTSDKKSSMSNLSESFEQLIMQSPKSSVSSEEPLSTNEKASKRMSSDKGRSRDSRLKSCSPSNSIASLRSSPRIASLRRLSSSSQGSDSEIQNRVCAKIKTSPKSPLTKAGNSPSAKDVSSSIQLNETENSSPKIADKKKVKFTVVTPRRSRRIDSSATGATATRNLRSRVKPQIN